MNIADAFQAMHSLEAEQALLGGLLLDNNAFDRIGPLVTATDFYDQNHQSIFATIASLIVARKPADVITVFEAGGHDLAYLHSLSSSVPSSSNARGYAAIVKERSVNREIVRLSGEAFDIARGEDKAESKLDAIQTLFSKLQVSTAKSMPLKAGDLLAPTLDRLMDLSDGKRPVGQPCGIGSIDRVLNGGFRPGGLYILAARPSVGKSSLAEAICLGVARKGGTAAFLSQEMPSAELMDRAIANLGHVNYEALQRGQLEPAQWDRTTEAAETIRALPLWFDDQAGLKLVDIRAKAQRLKREGLRVLVVDYLQLCVGSKKGASRTEEIGEISRGLKGLAKELEISVIALSQLNRDVEKRASPKPTLSDLRDSGEIEQDADCVMFLWPCREADGQQIVGLTFAKNRQGRRGIDIPLEFQGIYQRWYESNASLELPKEPKGKFE